MSRDDRLFRRAFLASAGLTLAAVDTMPARAASGLRFVQPNVPIKGISSVAPVANWAAPSYGLTPRRTAALHQAGFNTLRLFLPLNAFHQAQASGARRDLEATTTRWLNYLQNGLASGFKLLVSWGSTFEERTELLSGEAATARFRASLAAVARGLSQRFPPEAVALEIMNEPPEEARLTALGFRSWTADCAPMFCADIRAAAPNLTIVVQGASGGWAEVIPDFDLTRFDENTMFCFHFYTPGEFTHQGVNYPEFYGIPFPITRYPGGRSRMQADIEARIEARPSLSAAEKAERIQRYRAVLDYLWNPASPLGPDWVAWPKLDAWVAANRVNPLRILCGEFGVVSDLNFNGSPGCDLLSRAAYLRAVRQAVEARGFGGWVAHQALGDFNLFEQQSVSRHGQALIPELAEALFH